MKKLLFWPYQAYVWLFYFPVCGVLTLVAGWLTVLMSWAVSPRWASWHIARRWGRLLAYLVPMPVVVEGEQHLDRHQSFVVVANHASQFDIPALYGWLNIDLKWVIKKELESAPGIGIGCRKAGHIFVDRRDPAQAREAVNAALEGLEQGIGILFFAEGTRSRDGRLLPFKKGAFRIAVNHRLPILPVTLVGTGNVMPARTLRIFPGRVRVVIHPPITPDPHNTDEMRRLINVTRATISSALPPDLRGPDAT